MESLSSCFMCGVTISGGGSSATTSKRRRTSYNLGKMKDLVGRVCELFSVEATDEDWGGTEDGQHKISCEGCFEVLQNVERVHEVVLNAQKELQLYLDQVELRILKSGSALQCSLWKRTCYQLRRGVLNKTEAIIPTIAEDHQSLADLSRTCVKNESANEADANLEENVYLEDCWDNLAYDDDVPMPDTDEQMEVDFSIPQILTIQSHPATSDASSSKRKGKKRKITVIVEEDELPVQNIKDVEMPERRSGRLRSAKKSAEKAIRQQNSYSSDDDEGDNCTDGERDNEEDYSNDKFIRNEAGENDEDANEEISASLFKPKEARLARTGKPREVPSKNPLLVVEEDLYMYRWGIFIRKTFTHLECLAHDCGFHTEWNWYSSFQVIRKHLDDSHRTTKQDGRNGQTPHPCVMCKIVCKNRQALYNHLRQFHTDTIGQETTRRAVCECCLKFVNVNHVKGHQFSHKSAEEKAVAFETNQVPTKILRSGVTLESINGVTDVTQDVLTAPRKVYSDLCQKTEKKYACNYENCSKTFHSQKLLAGHKQTHLPRALRTDLVVCPECGKELVKKELRSHMQRFHHRETADTLGCPYCDKRYLLRDKWLLESHIRRHKGELPFLCTECGKQFPSNNYLQGHIAAVHVEQDPITCEWCGQVYVRVHSWRRHMREKHGDKYLSGRQTSRSKFYAKPEVPVEGAYGPVQKFPCFHCDTICGYRSTLRRHMATVHDIGVKKERRKRSNPKAKAHKGLRSGSGGNADTVSEVEQDDDSSGGRGWSGHAY